MNLPADEQDPIPPKSTRRLELPEELSIGSYPGYRTKLDALIATGDPFTIDASLLKRWDSSLLLLLTQTKGDGPAKFENIPPGAETLLSLLRENESSDENAPATKPSLIRSIGKTVSGWVAGALDLLTFLGELAHSVIKVVSGRGTMRIGDVIAVATAAGPAALPIVTTISVLVGLILAFVGSVQLEQFGAVLYIANLVGIGMAREMGAVMTGVIMSGRTGAAFAAELGTMEVNEEIDALRAFGFAPMDFLVLPRVLALCMMMPLLCIYADVMGILGGAAVTYMVFDVSIIQYLEQTRRAVMPADVILGIVKSSVFGVLIAVSGCWRGIRCSRSAAAVGACTTASVVSSILWIVLADALFAVISQVLDV